MTTPAPRLMSGSEAAAYCGVTVATWSKWVADGSMPKPVIGRRWDRKAIDLALDKLSGIQSAAEDDPYLVWKAQHEAEKAARAESDWERRYEARKAAERKARPPRKKP
ncbi:helix-turn-helix transcriptional regulator [Bradyrhizobium liaoningense]